jgi:hypothetical protein
MMDSAKRLAGFGLLLILVALLLSSELPGGTSPAQAQTVEPPVIPPGSGPPPQVVHDYVLQSTRRISRTLFEFTYEAYVSNWGDQDATISATLAPLPSNATIVDGALDFGFVPQGATVKASDTFTIRHDRIAALDEYALPWWVQATPAELTTYELIDQGNANGEIDDETVLVYKLFADYADERLPAQYRGRDDAGVDGRAIEAVRRNFAGLSQPTQDLLAPFLMRPDEPGSWAEVQAANEAGLAGALQEAGRGLVCRPQEALLPGRSGPGHPGTRADHQQPRPGRRLGSDRRHQARRRSHAGRESTATRLLPGPVP